MPSVPNSYRNVRIVLACRTFDLENDYRFQKFVRNNGIAIKIQAPPTSIDEAKNAISGLKIDVSILSEQQLEFFTVPLHLTLLAEIADDLQSNLSFQTLKDLFDVFWNRKTQSLRERYGYSVPIDAINEISEFMNAKQQLFVPGITIEHHIDALTALTSERLLSHDKEKNRYSFFHESFFDYCFARRFSASNDTLFEFLTKTEQHIFRRAQVRQILLHRRSTERRRYLTDLKNTLSSEKIRYHIKSVVLALLRNLNDPKSDEWELLSSVSKDKRADLPVDILLKTIYGRREWFLLLDSLGLITKWLSSFSTEEKTQAIALVRGIQSDCPDRVADLLSPYIGQEEWMKHIGEVTYPGQ